MPPVVFLLDANTVQAVTFSNVSGTVDFGNPTAPSSPDGGNFPYEIASYGGISGIKVPACGCLVGVFLDDTEPSEPAPPVLDFNVIGTNFTTLSPELRQTFFIGDGLTDRGIVQQFRVPPKATRLFLGLADAHYSGAPPGFYNDNTGWFNVTVNAITRPSSDVTSVVQSSKAISPTPTVYTVSLPAETFSNDRVFGYRLPEGVRLTREVEASSDLIHWVTATNLLFYFRDLDSTKYSQRFYQFRER